MIALVLALLLLGVLISLTCHQALARLELMAHQVMPLSLAQKNQGLLLQRKAFTMGNVLPVYGSSELTLDREYRASEFFASAPTGFQVCPVGMPGNTCLLIATKLAAVGDAVRGHKVVVLLSDGWFQRPQPLGNQYMGNFSELQTIASLENPALPDSLKRQLAHRFLRFSNETLASRPLLQLGARCQFTPPPLPSLSLPLLHGLLQCNLRLLEQEDAMLCRWDLRKPAGKEPWQAHPQSIAWQTLLEQARPAAHTPYTQPPANAEEAAAKNAKRRQAYLSSEQGEWADLALLLQVINALQAKALIVCLPLAGEHLDRMGVTAETRHNFFYAHVERLCHEHQVPVLTMEEYEKDRDFLQHYLSHPSSLGWLQLDRVLDDFWHDRLTTL